MKNFFVYIVTFALIYFVISRYITQEHLIIISNLNVYEILVSLVLAFTIFSINGHQFSYILNKTSKTKLSTMDQMFFSSAKNLWSYIIPLQGSLAYSLAFIKFKYRVKFIDNFSLNLFLLSFNFFMAGIVGILYVLTARQCNIFFILFSLLFASIPILMILISNISKRIETPSNKFFRFCFVKICSINKNLGDLWKDLNFTFGVFYLSMLSTFVTIIWLYWSTKILNINIDFLSVVFLSFILKMSRVFKITPGNLGVEQLVFGGLFSLMNYDPHAGVLISLFNKAITIFISLTAGSVFTIVNLKYFKTDKIKEVLRGDK